jgi:hypothetical protein
LGTVCNQNGQCVPGQEGHQEGQGATGVFLTGAEESECTVWMTEIETLFSKAGLMTEDEKIRLLKRNVRQMTLEQIYRADALSTSYAD